MNKKIKKIFLTLLTIITFISFNDKVKAELDNGSGGAQLSTGAGTCDGYSFCLYNNANMSIVRISLWYYNGTNFEKIGRHFYYVDDKAYDFLGEAYKGESGERIIFKLNPGADGKSKLNSCANKTYKYKCISDKIREYYGETGEYSIKVTDNSKIDINWMLSSPNSSDTSKYYEKYLTKESQLTNKTTAATYGYRVFIEPVVNVANIKIDGKNYKYGIYTVKDLVQITKTSNPGRVTGKNSLAQLLFTQWDDVGISAGVNNPPNDTSNNYCENITFDQFKNKKNGCGYNILDLSNFAAPPKCYIKTVSGNVECANTDRNNIGEFKEIYKKDTCPTDNDSKDSTNTEHGKLMVETAACNVYCKESAEVSFPGNMSRKKAISLVPTEGSYFAWPTRRYDPTGIYPMSMQSRMNCTIVEKTTGCDKEQVKKKVKDKFDSLEYSAILEAGTNKKINGSLVVDEQEIKSGSNDANNTFYYKKIVYFKIDSTKNRCYNVQEQTVRDCENALENEFDRKQGVVSLSEKDSTSIRYTLKLKNVKLGTDNQFGKLIGTYTCYYRISNSYSPPNEPGPCKCPAGTLREGEDLYEQITKDKTCAELQATECDYCTCPKDSLYPDEILDVGTGICDSKKMEHCYNSCETKDGIKINITDCTKSEMSKGYSIGEAAYKCTLNTPACAWKYKTCTYHGNLSKLDEVTKEICDLNKVASQENTTNNNDISNNINGYKDKENDIFNNFSQGINENQNNNSQFVTQEVNLSKCLEIGFSATTCKNICCPKTVCVGDDCYTCTEDCKWEMQGTIEKNSTLIKYVRKCSDNEICDKIVLACPGGEEKMNNPMSCLQKELNGVTNIQEALNTGKITPSDVERAFKACQEEVCPGVNQKILYRVIDLDNPFPGKNNEGTLTEFSNVGRGRKPGNNWNSVTTVKNKILNARGAKGYKLYEQEPLYVITLTPSNIEKIREYNKDTKYSNFDMECTNTNETGNCISNFLHKNYSYIVTGGKCKSIKDSVTFDACYSDKQ